MKAAILAGGLGTRLKPYTDTIPKPMLLINDKPILEHQIEWLKQNNITDIIICTSYLGDVIKDYFKDGKQIGVSIEYAYGELKIDTAGRLKTAEKLLGKDDTFVCMYGDSIFEFNLKNMIKQHIKKKAFVTMSLNEYKTNLSYGVIETSKNGKVLSWKEKPVIKANVNMGCYVMEPKIFGLIPKDRQCGMDDIIKKAIKRNEIISSFITKKGFIDIGNKESYDKAKQDYNQKQRKNKKLK